jgi:hypothetical protein
MAQDNIRVGKIVKPVSSRAALAVVNGETYKIDNPNSGPLFAGDHVPVYRSTGAANVGKVR